MLVAVKSVTNENIALVRFGRVKQGWRRYDQSLQTISKTNMYIYKNMRAKNNM